MNEVHKKYRELKAKHPPTLLSCSALETSMSHTMMMQMWYQSYLE